MTSVYVNTSNLILNSYSLLDMNRNQTNTIQLFKYNTSEAERNGIADEMLTKIEVFLLIFIFVTTIISNLIVIFILVCFKSTNLSISSTSCYGYTNVSRMSFYIINLSLADINVAFMSVLPQLLWRNYI